MTSLLFLLLFLVSTCCGDFYVITQGDHYANHTLIPSFRDGTFQQGVVNMDLQTGNYFFNTANPGGPETACAAMLDANKVFGSSRCGYLNSHHKDSDRFTWRRHPRCYAKKTTSQGCVVVSNATCTDIQFIAYAYDDGRKPYGPNKDPNLFYLFPQTFQTQTNYIMSFNYTLTSTYYEIRNAANSLLLANHTIPHRPCSNYKHGYHLYPYFGGQNVAPQTMGVTLLQ